jgi:stringent starvation protein B
MSPHPLPPKKEVALALLERSSVYVHLDPRQSGVMVPQWFKKQAQLVLQIGLNMPVPIPDLRLDDDGMCCTLSFNRAPFYCVVPWASVFAMVGDDGRGMVWPDDVPSDVAIQAQGRAGEPAPRKEVPPKPASVRDVSKDASKAEAPKAKRARKRPALAAVGEADGAGPRSSPAVPPAAESGAEDASTDVHPENPPPAARPAAAPAVAPATAAEAKSRTAAGAGRKPKRELPPYLRVVK